MPGLLRVIVLALLIWLVIRLYQRFKALARERSTKSSQPGRPIENMVRCEQCGTHIPEKDALKRDGHYYCSRAHLPHDS